MLCLLRRRTRRCRWRTTTRGSSTSAVWTRWVWTLTPDQTCLCVRKKIWVPLHAEVSHRHIYLSSCVGNDPYWSSVMQNWHRAKISLLSCGARNSPHELQREGFIFILSIWHVLFALMHISLWYEENHHNETSVIMLLVPASESTRHILFNRKKTQRMLYQNTKKLLFFYVSNWNIFPRKNILDLLKSFHTLIIQKHFSGVQIMAVLVNYYCYFRKTLLAFRTLIY